MVHFCFYVKTKKTDLSCFKQNWSVNLVITEFSCGRFKLLNLAAGVLNCSKTQKWPDFSLYGKNPTNNSYQCHNLNKVKFDNFLKPCYKGIITEGKKVVNDYLFLFQCF